MMISIICIIVIVIMIIDINIVIIVIIVIVIIIIIVIVIYVDRKGTTGVSANGVTAKHVVVVVCLRRRDFLGNYSG